MSQLISKLKDWIGTILPSGARNIGTITAPFIVPTSRDLRSIPSAPDSLPISGWLG